MRLRSRFVVRFGFPAAVPPKLWCRLDSRDLVRALSLGSCLRCAWLRAAWSAGTSRRRHVRFDSVLPQARPAPSPRSPLATVQSARPCRKVLSELLAPSCSGSLLSSSLTTASSTPCSRCHALFTRLEVLSIVLGEWFTSKIVCRCFFWMFQLARNLRLCNGLWTAICFSSP